MSFRNQVLIVKAVKLIILTKSITIQITKKSRVITMILLTLIKIVKLY
jgi:hypothetical protein